MAPLPEIPEIPESPSSLGLVSHIWNYAVKEGSVIRAAPLSFGLAILVVGGLIYYFLTGNFKDAYTGRIDNVKIENEKLDATIKSLQATIEFQDRRLSDLGVQTTPAPTPGAASRIQYVQAARVVPLYPLKVNVSFSNRGTS